MSKEKPKFASRIMSGVKPTSQLHIGNYLGAIKNWVRLSQQSRDNSTECFWAVVDQHALTDPPTPAHLTAWSWEAVELYLAAGLDPNKDVIYFQSAVPQTMELNWLFTCLTGMGWLERMTQYKDKSGAADEIRAGLFCYPVLMTADVAIVQATQVPVGQDQIQHLELSREIIRRFNKQYRTLFPEPKPLLSPTPKILGLDGKAKMSKSLNNTIPMISTAEEIKTKLKSAVTDTKRVRRTDPGEPNDCNVYSLHQIFSPVDTQLEMAAGCRSAGISCADCKMRLANTMELEIGPIRDKIYHWRGQRDTLKDIVQAGNQKAAAIGAQVISQAKSAVGLAL